MKRKILSYLLLLFAVTILTNCSKKDSSPPPADTKLQLTILDNLGNPVSAASVRLYGSESDFGNDINYVGLGTTNATGVIVFSQLSAKKYYWYAEKGCTNNMLGSVYTLNPIAANNTTTISCVLAGTGKLRFVNTSSNPYRVYINGQVFTEMLGNTTRTVEYAAVASYTLRVLQLSGYAITPTDQTYTGNVTCGGTLVTTFP